MIERMTLILFAGESNRIEGIGDKRKAFEHADALERLLSVDRMLVTADVDEFVYKIQPDARIRSVHGLDVRVGGYIPIPGGPHVAGSLTILIGEISKNAAFPFHMHKAYENLHPYTDGNGRSGRALWLWQMHKYYKYKGEMLFLHKWYYQSLDGAR